MLNRQGIPRRSIQGFTMMEALVVVGILVIVALLAAPNVVQMQKRTRVMELDAKAQQIYNAVQYNLTSLESMDQLYKLEYQAPESDATDEQKALAKKSVFGKNASGKSNATDLSAAYNSNAAYTGDGHDTGSVYGLFVADKSSETVNTYLLTSEDNSVTEGVTDGHFYVEFSPSTGEVYSVFYYEDDGSGAYPQFNAMSTYGRTNKGWRIDNQVGYYGGKQIQPKRDLEAPKPDVPGGNVTPTPGGDPTWTDLQFEVVNREELYAHITGADLNNEDVFNNIKVSLKVTGYTRKAWMQKDTWEKTYTAAGEGTDEKIDFVSGAGEADVVIDSMRHGMAVTDLFPDLLPGSDINVTIKLIYKDKTIKELSFTTNSLFAKIENDKATISSLRHLNNLDMLRKYLAGGYTADEMNNYNQNYIRFTGIDMQTDIEFDGYKWADEDVSLQSRQDFVGNGLNPLASYEPITLTKLMESSPGNYTFEGNGHTFKNFVIAKYKRNDDGSYVKDEDGNFVLDDAGENTGMVSISCIKFQNMNFQDPVVIGGDNTGVLAGTHTAGSINNVHIYTTKGDGSYVSGGDNVGGLVGNLNSPSGGAWIGFENCSSTVDVRGGSYVGGIVGNGGTWSSPKNSYVGYRKTDSGYEANRVVSISGTGDYVGGMCGTMNMPSDDNHVIANVSGSSYVGGLAGHVGGAASIENSDVGDPGGVFLCKVEASADNVGGVAGYSGATSSNCAYKTVSYVNSVKGRDNVGGFAGTAAGKHDQCAAHGSVSPDGILTQTTVEGRNNVGGFVGLQSAGEMTGCYAATTVNGSTGCCGGFVGLGDRGSADSKSNNCYSSGAVTGNKWVGGFIGYRANDYGIGNCYTTSNVRALSYAGSFAGEYVYNNGGDIWPDSMRSFGRLAPLEGADTSTFGGFVGVCGAKFSEYNHTTYYLSFAGYNQFSETLEYQPPAYSMQACRNAASNAVSTAYPLSSNLLGKDFPFDGISLNGSVLPHYGDWYAE